MVKSIYRKYPELNPAFKEMLERPPDYPKGGAVQRVRPPEPPRSGASGMQKSPAQSQTSKGSLDRFVRQLSDGKTIDLSPSEWRRLGEEASKMSRWGAAALIRTLLSLLGVSRLKIPLSLINWLLDILRRRAEESPDDYDRRGGAAGWDMKGWGICGICTEPFGPPVKRIDGALWFPGGLVPGAGNCRSADICLGGQGMPALSWDAPVGPTTRSLVGLAAQPFNDRGQVVIVVGRPREMDGLMPDPPEYYPETKRIIFNPPMPNPFAAIDPNLSKPGDGVGPPAPLPVPLWSRGSSEWPQGREVGNSDPIPVDKFHPDAKQIVQEWTFGPGAPSKPPTKTETKEPWSDRALPDRRTRERKIRIVVAGKARRILDFIGESGDLVECFWENIPKERRSKKFWQIGMKGPAKPRIPQMLREIYDYFPDADQKYMNKVVACIGVNQVEDFVWGQISQKLGKGAANIGRPVGFMTGPAL